MLCTYKYASIFSRQTEAIVYIYVGGMAKCLHRWICNLEVPGLNPPPFADGFVFSSSEFSSAMSCKYSNDQLSTNLLTQTYFRLLLVLGEDK